MNVFPRICKTPGKFKSNSSLIYFRKISLSSVRHEKQKTDLQPPAMDILAELQEPGLTEEEISEKRFKARLPERLYRSFVKKEALPLESKYDFRMTRLRKYYARYGKDSKLNPGICWPTREQILETIHYDKIFEPPLQETLSKVENARLEKEEKQKQEEAEVDKNMANLDKWMKEYYAKIEQKKADILELRKKREKLVEEISEYLGYEIDPRDPRFQEAVQQRDKERKKAVKAKKQQESYEKMIAKLKQMAEQ
ncbi:growth arrest and DNA damage-inducible proteins-interacting protein 1-like [Uloborus diversus]|uniref:growth arrest and DNA damage-inducible proteins-interacting protein 1-like n=1 Tax=Uloborus diversus TaxID=327109 RepID=UPI00240A7984|nr:growth arrest and DNA damage-inducible proteins-interacting protein 1-like [Uloborus diversus]